MGAFKRALISVIRSWAKSLLLMGIFLIIGTTIAAVFSLRQAVTNTELQLRRNTLPVLTIEFSWQKLVQYMTENGYEPGEEVAPFSNFLSREVVYKISSFPEVTYFDYSQWLSIRHGMNEIILRGASSPQFLDLKMEFIEITEGTTFTNEQLSNGDFVVIVPSYFAKDYGLSIGDTFHFSIHAFIENDTYLPEWGLLGDFEFEIIGIHSVNYKHFDMEPGLLGWSMGTGVSEDDGDNRVPNLQREIFTPNETIINISNYLLEHYSDYIVAPELFIENNEVVERPIFLLEDPLLIDSFHERVQPLLHDFMMITDMVNRFEPISNSMAMMNDLADNILYVTIGAAILVLVLVLLLFLNDRRHEVGILLALGEDKRKIMMQVIYETVIIGVVGTTLALFIGYFLSHQISMNFIETQMSAVNLRDRDLWDVDTLEFLSFGGPMTGEAMLEYFEFSMSGTMIGLYYGAMVVLTVIGVGLSLIYVMRMHPKKILE